MNEGMGVCLSVQLSVKLFVRELVGYPSMPGVHTGKQMGLSSQVGGSIGRFCHLYCLVLLAR